MKPRSADACAQFRREVFRTKPGRLKDRIERVKCGAVLKAGIVALRRPPRNLGANAYMFVDEDGGANMSNDASQAGRLVQISIPKCVDLSAV